MTVTPAVPPRRPAEGPGPVEQVLGVVALALSLLFGAWCWLQPQLGVVDDLFSPRVVEASAVTSVPASSQEGAPLPRADVGTPHLEDATP